jgi:hypothetical protein
LPYKDTKLFFRGDAITKAQLKHLNETHGIFSKVTDIVVVGQSAGGLAVFLWANYITDNAKQAKVWASPDCGIFLDRTNIQTKQNSYRISF